MGEAWWNEEVLVLTRAGWYFEAVETNGGACRGKPKGLTVVNTGGDKAVHADRSGVFGEGGADTVHVAGMETCRPAIAIDVRLK